MFQRNQYLDKLLADATDPVTPEERDQLGELLDSRKNLLDQLNTQLGSQLNLAINIKLNQQQLERVNKSLQSTLQQQIFWVSSNKPLDWAWLVGLPSAMLSQLQAASISVNINEWSQKTLPLLLLVIPMIMLGIALRWKRQLLRDTNVAANLVFEVDEDLLDCNLAASTRLFEMLRRVGSRSSISKFGKGLGSFRLYRELKPDYIKLDPSLINVLEREHTSQQFIRMIVEVSHRLGCVVIAEGVENIAQKQLLETMYIDAIQGYLIARPTPLTQGYSIEPIA